MKIIEFVSNKYKNDPIDEEKCFKRFGCLPFFNITLKKLNEKKMKLENFSFSHLEFSAEKEDLEEVWGIVRKEYSEYFINN